MKNLRRLHVYGSTSIQSVKCSVCKGRSFVIEGHTSCCGDPVPESDPQEYRIEVDKTGAKRSIPNKSEQARILDSQDGACFYCFAQFGSYRTINKKLQLVRIQWDHIVPFSYNGNNAEFVAACSLCNSIKSNLQFSSLEEARTHIQLKVYEKTIPAKERVPQLPEGISAEASLVKVLYQALPVPALE